MIYEGRHAIPMIRNLTATSLRRSHLPALLLCAAVVFSAPAWSGSASELERQRQLFADVIPSVERGDWSAVENLAAADKQRLQHYVLWPDLRAAYLKKRLAEVPVAEMDAFLAEYGSLRPARTLRYKLALHLAKNGELAAYHRLYERFYQGQNIARLDCLALQAELDAGRQSRVNARAKALWLIGTSQVRECDPVFDYLEAQQLLGRDDYRTRFGLAIEAREFQLARWLAKKLDQQHLDIAANWIKAQAHPEEFLRAYGRKTRAEVTTEQLVYAAERLTYRDPERALAAWKRVVRRANFSDEQQNSTLRHIALWTARDNLDNAYGLLLGLPDAALDAEVAAVACAHKPARPAMERFAERRGDDVTRGTRC